MEQIRNEKQGQTMRPLWLPGFIVIVVWLVGQPAVAKSLAVEPPAASPLRPVELTQLLYRLLPDLGHDLDDPNVPKLSMARVPPTKRSNAAALVRVRNHGAEALILKPERKEIAWMIEFFTSGDHGADKAGWLELSIGPSEEYCQGPNYRGCGFTEQDLLESRLFKSRLICTNNFDVEETLYRGNYMHFYVVTAPGKRTVLVGYDVSTGWTGSSHVVEIHEIFESSKLCSMYH